MTKVWNLQIGFKFVEKTKGELCGWGGVRVGLRHLQQGKEITTWYDYKKLLGSLFCLCTGIPCFWVNIISNSSELAGFTTFPTLSSSAWKDTVWWCCPVPTVYRKPSVGKCTVPSFHFQWCSPIGCLLLIHMDGKAHLWWEQKMRNILGYNAQEGCVHSVGQKKKSNFKNKMKKSSVFTTIHIPLHFS